MRRSRNCLGFLPVVLVACQSDSTSVTTAPAKGPGTASVCAAPGEAEASSGEALAVREAARWNAHCPMSGNPIDPASYFEHEGRRVYFCNPRCAEKGGREPELWLARVYGSGE